MLKFLPCQLSVEGSHLPLAEIPRRVLHQAAELEGVDQTQTKASNQMEKAQRSSPHEEGMTFTTSCRDVCHRCHRQQSTRELDRYHSLVSMYVNFVSALGVW